MSEDGYIKLSDFGVAKILPNIEDCRSTSGTHGYMVSAVHLAIASSSLHSTAFQAPEVYVDDHIHGTAADWFAAGITLHEFLTGRRPYEVSRLQAFRSMGSTTLAEYTSRLAESYDDSDNSSDGVQGMQRLSPEMKKGLVGGRKRDMYALDHLNGCDFLSWPCKHFIRSLLCISVSSYHIYILLPSGN
jgi:serine/threonine protein kinase